MAHQPPSRIKYLESHPSIRIRMPEKLRDEFELYAKANGITLAELVARLIKDQKKPLADFAEGYRVGYASAIDGELLEVNCGYCGRPLKVSQKQVIELAERLLKFKHIECPCGSDKIEITRRQS